ncbi:MAG: protoporphyrinogen oxidase [Dermatophilaceae bacterium]
MKVSFIAGVAVGYVLGARAGRERYEQIRRTSGKVWNSGPVQKQVGTAKEAARTKAAPMVADLVADAARATGEKLRSSRTVSSETITADAGTPSRPPTRSGGPAAADATPPHGDPWADATRARG